MNIQFKETDTLGHRIRILRLNMGLTQKELGEKVNLSQSGIYQLESDKCHQTRKLAAFSKVFGIPPEELDTYDTHKRLPPKSHQERFKSLKRDYPDWWEIIKEAVH
jgi:transcriptional regulator with XRE-family HTH domain